MPPKHRSATVSRRRAQIFAVRIGFGIASIPFLSWATLTRHYFLSSTRLRQCRMRGIFVDAGTIEMPRWNEMMIRNLMQPETQITHTHGRRAQGRVKPKAGQLSYDHHPRAGKELGGSERGEGNWKRHGTEDSPRRECDREASVTDQSVPN